jgi:predicted O-methyltransferase YrrM
MASEEHCDRLALARLGEVIAQVVAEGRVMARSDGVSRAVFPVGINPEEGEALCDWVIREDAVRTIEIGLGYGIGALFICQGLLGNGHFGARHLVFDPYQETMFANTGLQLLAEAGVAHFVEFHSEPSQIALPRLLGEQAASVDLAFVDGDHRFDAVFLDLVYLNRLLRPGGIVFIDDYHYPSVHRAVAFCIANLDWTIEQVSHQDDHHHWAAVRTPPVEPRRSFDHYADF